MAVTHPRPPLLCPMMEITNLVSPIRSSSWNQCGVYTLLLQLFPIIFPQPLRQPFPPEVGGEILWERKQGSHSWSPLFLPTPLFLKEHFSSPGIFILLTRRIKISQDLTYPYNRPQCLTLKENPQINSSEVVGSPQLLREWICVSLHHTGSKTASKRLYNGTTVVFVLRIHHTKPCIWNPKWPFLSGPSPTWEGKYHQIAWHFLF